LFDLWGQPLGPEQAGPAHGPVTALVNGIVVGGNPRDISLGAHDVIQLDVGAVVPFRPYVFPAGL
jgi:methionine aminopeptidase